MGEGIKGKQIDSLHKSTFELYIVMTCRMSSNLRIGNITYLSLWGGFTMAVAGQRVLISMCGSNPWKTGHLESFVSF